MALPIKSTPTLYGKVAEEFVAKAEFNYKNRRGSIDFTKEASMAKKVLIKSRL